MGKRELKQQLFYEPNPKRPRESYRVAAQKGLADCRAALENHKPKCEHTRKHVEVTNDMSYATYRCVNATCNWFLWMEVEI